MLYLKVKGSKIENENLEVISDVVYQLGFIQKSVDLWGEQREYIVNKCLHFKGSGDPQEAKSTEYYKKLIEAEKQVDRFRKEQRLERKL